MPVRTTKIDSGSPWRWYADPEPGRQYLAMATIIELKTVWSLPRFEWHTQKVHRQLARVPGLIGYSFRGQFPYRYWTLSAWEDGKALRGFVKAGPHDIAMTTVVGIMRMFRRVHWNVDGAALPLRWADGLPRLDKALAANPTAADPTAADQTVAAPTAADQTAANPSATDPTGPTRRPE
jgi:hypothetical protein